MISTFTFFDDRTHYVWVKEDGGSSAVIGEWVAAILLMRERDYSGLAQGNTALFPLLALPLNFQADHQVVVSHLITELKTLEVVFGPVFPGLQIPQGRQSFHSPYTELKTLIFFALNFQAYHQVVVSHLITELKTCMNFRHSSFRADEQF
jgi:hypothetical protein